MVKALVDDEIRRFRDTFIGIAQANWELRNASGANATAIFEETYAAGQQAWNTQAASALARMTARLGAGETELGRRIRRNQDLSDRAINLNRETMHASGRLEHRAARASGIHGAAGAVPRREHRKSARPGTDHHAADGAGARAAGDHGALPAGRRAHRLPQRQRAP